MNYNYGDVKFSVKGVLISVIFSIIVIAGLKYIDIMILADFILIAILFYKNSFIVPGIIIIFLSVTGPSVEKIRDFITLGSMVVLAYLFINKYGSDYLKYPKVPLEVAYFTIYMLFSILITTFLTGLNPNSLAAIIRIIIFFSLCYIFYGFIEGKEVIHKYVISVIIASVIICISIYLEIANTGIKSFIIEGQLTRFAGAYGNPNYVGLLLIITTTLIVSMLLAVETKKQNWKKLILWLLLLNNTIIMLVINSRASIAGVLLSISFVLYIIKRKYFIRAIIISAVVVGIVFIIPVARDFFLLFIRLDTIGQREYFWKAGLDMISDHFLVGVGPDMFLSKFYTYLPSSASFLTEIANTGVKPSPHNFIMYFTCEMGILGFIAALYIFGLFFYMGFKSIKIFKNEKTEYYILAVTMTGIGIGVFIRSFYEVDGVLTYGYITRDLAFWLIYIIQIFIYQNCKKKNLRLNLNQNNPEYSELK